MDDLFDMRRDVERFQDQLIAWYEGEFRDLPWRQTKDPYCIWVSEIMLQQTQVKKVIPYYERFIGALPSIAALANAPLDAVLKLWEGLGYYARARNLHRASLIVDQFGGTFPHTLADVQKLPGIGPYTAAAILSMAFEQPLPAIDGNVNRVLSRLFTLAAPPRSPHGRRMVAEKAAMLFDRDRPGIYNQAIMELGALICTPASPKCAACPVGRFCLAQRSDRQQQFPMKSPRKERPHKTIAVGLVWRDDHLLIDQRHANGLLGGLWEFPGGHVEEGESCEDAVIREVKEELDVDVKVLNHFATLEHQYTHFTITLHAYHCRYVGGAPKAIGCQAWQWVTVEQLADLAFPRANGKIIEKLLADRA